MIYRDLAEGDVTLNNTAKQLILNENIFITGINPPGGNGKGKILCRDRDLISKFYYRISQNNIYEYDGTQIHLFGIYNLVGTTKTIESFSIFAKNGGQEFNLGETQSNELNRNMIMELNRIINTM